MYSLPSLIERLEKCDAPDREIDTDLMIFTQPDFAEQVRRGWLDFHPIQASDVASLQTERAYLTAHAEHYTASHDAVVALAQRTFDSPLIGVDNDIPGGETEPRWLAWCYGSDATAPTPALALCLALLRALHKKGQDDEG